MYYGVDGCNTQLGDCFVKSIDGSGSTITRLFKFAQDDLENKYGNASGEVGNGRNNG